MNDGVLSTTHSEVRRPGSIPGRLAMVASSLGLAALGQALADKRDSLGLALVAYLGGAALFALATHASARERPKETPAIHRPVNVSLLPWAFVLAALAFLGFHDNRMSLQGLVPWGLAILLCFLAPKARTTAGSEEGKTCWKRVWAVLRTGRWRIPWTTWGLIFAVLLGAFLRFHRLLEIPADLGWDLPYKYFKGERILKGEYLICFPGNYAPEGMFYYLIAAVAKLGKLSPYSIRITSALVGTASIIAIYLLARECVDRETGVYAALLLAVSKWHLVLSRSGYRVSLMPLFAILTLYGFARGLRRQPRDWAWCGLFLGLGLWTYKAFSVAIPTVIGTALVYFLLSCRGAAQSGDGATDDTEGTRWTNRRGAIARGVGIALLVALIAAVPVIRYAVDSPKIFLEREALTARLMTESLNREGISRVEHLARSFLTSLLMFAYEGDGNPRFGVPLQRHLGFISSILFALGVAGAIARFRRGGNAMLLLALLGFLLPMTLSMYVNEKPNCFRSSGVIGPSLVLAAIALRTTSVHVSQLLSRLGLRSFDLRLSIRRAHALPERALSTRVNLSPFPLLLVGIFLLSEIRETSRFYFHDLVHVLPHTSNYSIALEMARTMVDFEDGPAYIRIWPYWYDGRAVRVHLSAADRSWTAELPELPPDAPQLVGFAGKMLVLLHPQDEESLATLKAFFPRWTVKLDHFPGGEPSFVAFYGEK